MLVDSITGKCLDILGVSGTVWEDKGMEGHNSVVNW